MILGNVMGGPPPYPRSSWTAKEIVVMRHIAHRVAAVLSGVLVLGALALPATTANAAAPLSARAAHVATAPADCASPDNPVWGDGTCGP